jgi:hypothetical protein
MRISDDRYSRDQQRLDLALRLIRLEARTSTIRSWTGLSDDRIRKLYRSYVLTAGGDAVPRHRGKSPRQAAFFTRTPRTSGEASALASVCCLLEVLPPHPVRDSARSLPSVSRGDLLVCAFDAFRALVPRSELSFEHAAYLVIALAQGDELRLVPCSGCRGFVVADRIALRDPRCQPCSEQSGAEPPRAHSRTSRRTRSVARGPRPVTGTVL